MAPKPATTSVPPPSRGQYLRAHNLCLAESKNVLSAVLSTEGRVVGLCWADSNLKDLKGESLAWRGGRGVLGYNPV